MQFIYVIRHGETDANVKGKVNDKNITTPINKNGKLQAKKTGKYLQKEFPEIETAVRIYKKKNMLVRKNDAKYKEAYAVAADSAFFSVFNFKLVQGNIKKALKAPFSIVLSKSAPPQEDAENTPSKPTTTSRTSYNASTTTTTTTTSTLHTSTRCRSSTCGGCGGVRGGAASQDPNHSYGCDN